MPAARAAAILLGVTTALFVVGNAHATMVRGHVPLATVTAESGRIVHASVTDVISGWDDRGLPATWVTLAVMRTLKGTHGSRLVVKQFGVMEPLPDGTITALPDMPRYRVGDEVVLFLRPESAHGFTSPVGMRDGVYRVDAGHRVAHAAGRAGQDIDSFLAGVAILVGR